MNYDEEIPKYVKKPKKKKFGVQSSYSFFGKSRTHTRWYETERARDQAMIDLPRHECNLFKDRGIRRKYRKTER